MECIIKKLGLSNVNFVFIPMIALNTHHNLDVDVDNGNTTFPYQEILDTYHLLALARPNITYVMFNATKYFI
jgi:hypothetical protein